MACPPPCFLTHSQSQSHFCALAFLLPAFCPLQPAGQGAGGGGVSALAGLRDLVLPAGALEEWAALDDAVGLARPHLR
eukprot:352594-Chlamydomonas_euryale.AAC.15